MNPIILTKQGSDKVELYACGQCGRLCSPTIYFTGAENALKAALTMAEECCVPVVCACGKVCERQYRTACNSCIDRIAQDKEEARFAAATKFTVATAPDEPVCYNDDDYHSNVQSLCEYLAGGEDMSRELFPLRVWLCDRVTPALDPTRVVENLLGELEVDSDAPERFLTDIPALTSAIEEWNKKQQPNLWYPSNKRYVVIEYEDVYEDVPNPTPEPTTRE